MGWQVVKNPETEMYQIFSSVVDAFLLDYEVTRDELEDFWIGSRGQMSASALNEILEAIDDGRLPTGYDMTYAKAKMWDVHQSDHGPKTRQPDVCKICQEIENDEKNS